MILYAPLILTAYNVLHGRWTLCFWLTGIFKSYVEWNVTMKQGNGWAIAHYLSELQLPHQILFHLSSSIQKCKSPKEHSSCNLNDDFNSLSVASDGHFFAKCIPYIDSISMKEIWMVIYLLLTQDHHYPHSPSSPMASMLPGWEMYHWGTA